MMKYSNKKEAETAKKQEEKLDQEALEYLEKQLSGDQIRAKVKEHQEEFGGLITEEGAIYIIARELGWTPPLPTLKKEKETNFLTQGYLEEKASTERTGKDGRVWKGDWGSFIAIPTNVSAPLTSSKGDTYVVVDLVGADVQGVPLFLWREKALMKEYIVLNKATVFRSVRIQRNLDETGYMLSASKYFKVDPFEGSLDDVKGD